jgi:hypothetical protein
MVAGAVGSGRPKAASSHAGTSRSAVDDLLAGALGMRGGRAPSDTDPGVVGVESEVVEDESVVEEVIEEETFEDEVVDEDLVEIFAEDMRPSLNDLAQLDLFIEQELFDDAVSILERLEAEFPDALDLAERREKLGELGAWDRAAEVDLGSEATGGDAASAAAPVVQTQVSPPRSPEVEPVSVREEIFEESGDGDFIDLAKELEEELAEEEAMVEEATGRGKGRGDARRGVQGVSDGVSPSSCRRRTPTPTSTSASLTRKWDCSKRRSASSRWPPTIRSFSSRRAP